MKRRPKPGLPRLFDRPKYRQRNIIERMFGWLKENRRIVTRFDKLAKSYAAMVSLVCVIRCMRRLFSGKSLVFEAGVCSSHWILRKSRFDSTESHNQLILL